ncbi:MAG: hypothetical protein K6G50_05360 [bacterium]|nr:hypothetical protein [bacterium]
MSTRARNIISKALKFCRSAEVAEEERREYDLTDIQNKSRSAGISLKINYHGSIGFAFSEDTDDDKLLDEAVKNASEASQPCLAEKRTIFKPSGHIQLDRKAAEKSMISIIKRLDFLLPSLIPERDFLLAAKQICQSLEITNISGSVKAERILNMLTLESAGDIPVTGGIFTSMPPVTPDSLLCRLAWRARHSQDKEMPAQALLPAVFTASAAGALLSAFADNIICFPKTHSLYANMNEALTITDDRTIPGGAGTAPFDGEGEAAAARALVQCGRLIQPPADRALATLRQYPQAGMAARFWGENTRPGYSNLAANPGELTLGELCACMKNGILLDIIEPAEPESAQPDIFRCRIHTGFIVRGGFPICRIPPMQAAGRFSDMLGNGLTGIGSDRELHGRTLAPPLAFSALNFKYDKNGYCQLKMPGIWW